MKKIIASLLLAVSLPSYAFFYDGNQLSAWNNARKKALNNNAETVDYLDAGVYRGFVIATYNAFQNTTICPEPGITVGQVEDVVGLYLDNHPELRTKPASELAYKALASAFPCKK